MPPQLPSTKRSLPIALIRAREVVMAPIRKMLSKEGITEQQWRVLRVLSELGPQSASAICGQASLLPPSFTRIAVSMETRGLIKRAQNGADRRSHVFEISELGEQIIARNTELAAQNLARFKDRIGAQNYETLLDLLGDLSDGFDD